MDPWLQAAAIGALAVAIGLGFTFWGFRLFIILLPIWGFFFGFLFGAGLVTALFSDGFLATVTGWVVGFLVGVVFAVLSYLFYWFAVLFLGASVGYSLGLGLLALLGNGGDNLMGLIFGLVGAAIGAGLVVILRVPKYLIIALTAIGGAIATVAGVALIFQQITWAELSSGTTSAFQAIRDLGWLWAGATAVVAIVGIAYQIKLTAQAEELMYEAYRNPGMPSSTPPPPPTY